VDNLVQIGDHKGQVAQAELLVDADGTRARPVRGINELDITGAEAQAMHGAGSRLIDTDFGEPEEIVIKVQTRRLSEKESAGPMGWWLPCVSRETIIRPLDTPINSSCPWRVVMSAGGGKTYRPWQPQCYRQQAHSPASKLPEGDLVFFLLDVVPKLALSQFYTSYEQETRGGPPFDPAMMVCLLLYAYCVGVFSSRKIALACERHLAFLAIVGEDRPDFRTISDFRKLHLEAFKAVFVQVVRLAGAAGLVK